MGAQSDKKGTFEKVAPNLYRYSTSGAYFARAKRQGRRVHRSLKTSDLKVAQRKLLDFLKDIDRLESTGGQSDARRAGRRLP